jgi:hypothetical protein
VVHPNRSPRRSKRCLGAVVALAFAALVLALVPADGQEFLKKSFVTPGDPKPIYLSANAIATWEDGSQQVFLLRQNVYIEQGLIKLNMPESVVWVDRDRRKSTGIYYVAVYGEGNVTVKEQAQLYHAGRVLLDLATRGELKIVSRGQPVLQRPMPDDPVFARAQAERRIAQSGTQESATPKVSASNPPPSGPSAVPPPLTGGPPAGNTSGGLTANSAAPRVEPPPLASSGVRQVGWQDASPALGPTPAGGPTPAAVPPPVSPPPATNTDKNGGNAPLPAPPPLNSLPGGGAKQSSGATPALPLPVGPKPVEAQPVQLPKSTGSTTSPGTVPSEPPLPVSPKAVEAQPVQLPKSTGSTTAPGTVPLEAPLSGPPPPPERKPGGPSAELKLPLPRIPPQLNVRPRSGESFQPRSFPELAVNGEVPWVVTGGVILTITNSTDTVEVIDIEADRMVFWTKDASPDIINNMQSKEGETKRSNSLEFYLSGNVQILNQFKQETRVLRADEVYYDVSRNVAVALQSNLEVQQPKLPYPLNIHSDQLLQLNPKLFETGRTEISASALPSDPGLKIVVYSGTLEDVDTPRRNIFGFPIKDAKTGKVIKETQRIFRGRNMLVYFEKVPIFYWPYVQGDPEDPLGPLDDVGFNWNRIFGFQVFTTWNVYDLFGVTPIPGTRWQFDVDYMTARGPALGTEFRYAGKELIPGLPGKYEGNLRAYGIDDHGLDILGGNHGQITFITPSVSLPINHPRYRGWFNDHVNIQDLPYGFSAQGQLVAESDHYFLEQYFPFTFNQDINQVPFAYVKQQQGQWAWYAVGQVNDRNWMTQTNQLPELQGYLMGKKFLNDWVTYTTRADVGYFQLQTSHQPPPAYMPTDVNTNTGRFDLWQEASVPFTLGAFKLAPYAVFDAAYYTQDLAGTSLGRAYGGGGVRGSLPLSRLYPDVQSDLFNVNGIYHKIVLSANYYNVASNVSMLQLPQLDRLNDDASDMALRNIFPRQFQFNPGNAQALDTFFIFNPQSYALRRLLDNRIDTLNTIEVLQADIRQRWQTLRGFPGNQHVIDWMTLDISGSLFPHSNRDNFGELWGILQYDWAWNIGDSTSLVSNGWLDPIGNAARVFTFGANTSRPDRTNLFLGYRQLDPLNSKAVIANVQFPFSAKYALTASTLYDFGVHNQINSLTLTRIGTDVQVSIGFSYNSIVNTFGFNFMIMPNLLAGNLNSTTMSPTGASGMGTRK